MWNRFGRLYRALEEEQCKVLADPRALESITPGLRRTMAARLAGMPPLERARLLAFCVKYRGERLWLTLTQIVTVSSLCALLAYALFPQLSLVTLLLVSNLIGAGLVVFMLIVYFSHSMMFGKPVHLVMFMMICASVGGISGALGGAAEQGFTLMQAMEQKWVVIIAATLAAGLLIALPVTLMGAIRNREYKRFNTDLELKAERHRAAHELSESRLRLLHAQIEPHFLFNTLGAVQQLAEKGAPDAARLTASLIAFLRASLAEMRSEHVTLGADFALLEAYLQVMKARLGARLDYTLDLPQDLFQVTIPSMMLLTLVENAIKHGIEPSLQGGRIDVTSAADATRLQLTVRDSGPGLGSAQGSPPGSGHGLANVRARLNLLYGDGAALTVVDGDECGVVAVLTLPLNRETT